MRSRRWRRAVLAALAVFASGCDRGEDDGGFRPLVQFDTATVAIESGADTILITAELAETDDQRAYGLMDRPDLPPEHGMLFRYPAPQDSTAGFWMYRTRVPLDIAFLDERGRILSIMAMDPCESPDPRFCPVYSPRTPFSGALEVRRGFFERHGIGVGDRVRVAEQRGAQ